MEENVFKPRLGRDALAFVVIFSVLLALMFAIAISVPATDGFDLQSIGYLLISICIPLLNLAMLLPRLNIRCIRFSDDICVERFIGKAKRLPYAALRYMDGAIAVFSGYTIYADNFANYRELQDIFSACAARGLLELKAKSKKQASRDKWVRRIFVIISMLLLVVFFVYVYVFDFPAVIYFSFVMVPFIVLMSICIRRNKSMFW